MIATQTATTLPEHIVDQARNTDLIGIAERYGVQLKRESGASKAGPCPKCGGDDRFFVRDNRYKCRDTNGSGCGIHGDVITFVRLMEGCSFVEAVSMLTGYQLPDRPVRQIQVRPAKRATPQKRAEPSAVWIAKATQTATEATARLMEGEDGEMGRQYLLARGIEPHAWEAFGLGFQPDVPLPATWDEKRESHVQPKQPAIVMPWHRKGKIMGIRYRFLKRHEYANVDGDMIDAKQTALFGSYFEDGIYGAHALPAYTWLPVENSTGKRIENQQTLVICEGELNAISIWQVANPWGWQVLSLGSQSAHIPQGMMSSLGRHFGRILVWMDEPFRTREEILNAGERAIGVSSIPEPDGKKLDANDLLQSGKLGGFLAATWLKACRDAEEVRAVKYALLDAFEMGQLDAGAQQILGTL